jgi:hypothetical protein
LHIYAYDYVLGKCAKDSSSWFSGYNEKYFYDRGALVACAFPKTKHLMKWYFAWKASKEELLRFADRISCGELEDPDCLEDGIEYGVVFIEDCY